MTRPRFSMQPNAGHFIESYDKDTGLSVVLSLFLENQILEMSSAGDRIQKEYCTKLPCQTEVDGYWLALWLQK